MLCSPAPGEESTPVGSEDPALDGDGRETATVRVADLLCGPGSCG